MKIDKKNPTHWLLLALSGFWTSLAILLRPFVSKKSKRKRVLLYGHKLGGNLLALYRYMREFHSEDLDIAFLTMDRNYKRELMLQGVPVILAASSRCLVWLVSTDSIVSDHGLHAFSPLVRFTDIRFMDVWHSIPFKGFDGSDFRTQHDYDEIWVASESQRDLWITKYGFRSEIVHATGYARTDCLVERKYSKNDILRSVGIDPSQSEKWILYAPTWKQDSSSRNLFPFGAKPHEFLGALSGLAAELNATLLLRAHLNSDEFRTPDLDRVVQIPYARYPDTEAILLACDALICDWSSIAFDYLLLDRPTYFLDVEAPFRKGLSLGPEYRFGAIVSGMEQLISELRMGLTHPELYWCKHESRHHEIKHVVYGAFADGRASERCANRLLASIRTAN